MASDLPRVRYVMMSDNRQVKTAVITSERELSLHLPDFIAGVRNSEFLVGIDTEWKYFYDRFANPSSWAKVALLKLCNNSGFCLLINLHRFSTMPPSLINLLAIGDITFIGVDIRKQLDKLKVDYQLEIKSTVELTAVTAGTTRIHNLWKGTCGWKPKGVDEELMSWLLDNPWENFGENCTQKQLEYAVFSAYVTVKAAHSLFTSGGYIGRLMLRP